MPNSEPKYRLVIFDTIDDPQALREMICGATGMHPTDVVQWLARAPGVWPQLLEEPVGHRRLSWKQRKQTVLRPRSSLGRED